MTLVDPLYKHGQSQTTSGVSRVLRSQTRNGSGLKEKQLLYSKKLYNCQIVQDDIMISYLQIAWPKEGTVNSFWKSCTYLPML